MALGVGVEGVVTPEGVLAAAPVWGVPVLGVGVPVPLARVATAMYVAAATAEVTAGGVASCAGCGKEAAQVRKVFRATSGRVTSWRQY